MYGTDCRYVRVSANFSVARCRRPICGSARSITSPSSSSTRRSTPCAAGCCGPKLSVKLRISATSGPGLRARSGADSGGGSRAWRSILERSLVTVVLADHARHERARLDGDRLVDDTALGWIVLHLDVADQREVLAERMADEAV